MVVTAITSSGSSRGPRPVSRRTPRSPPAAQPSADEHQLRPARRPGRPPDCSYRTASPGGTGPRASAASPPASAPAASHKSSSRAPWPGGGQRAEQRQAGQYAELGGGGGDHRAGANPEPGAERVRGRPDQGVRDEGQLGQQQRDASGDSGVQRLVQGGDPVEMADQPGQHQRGAADQQYQLRTEHRPRQGPRPVRPPVGEPPTEGPAGAPGSSQAQHADDGRPVQRVAPRLALPGPDGQDRDKVGGQQDAGHGERPGQLLGADPPRGEPADQAIMYATTAVAPHGTRVTTRPPSDTPTPLLSSQSRLPTPRASPRVPGSAASQPTTARPAQSTHPARALTSPPATAATGQPTGGPALTSTEVSGCCGPALLARRESPAMVRRGESNEAMVVPC